MLKRESSLAIASALFLGCSQTSGSLVTGTSTSGGSTTASSSATSGSTGSSAGSTGAASSASNSGTSSGTSTGSSIGGSSSGGTSGFPDSGCSTVGAAELSSCVHGRDCQCPAGCVDDAALDPYLVPNTAVCELPCQTTADCASASEICRNGACSPNFCAVALPDGGTDVGAGAWQSCDVLDAGDGNCTFVPGLLGNLNTLLAGFYCQQSGQSQDICDLHGTRDEPALLCSSGLSCRQLFDGGGGCIRSCDRTVTPDTCPNGMACAGGYATSAFGACYVIGDGGCATGLDYTVGASCARALDCGCPQQCVVDPGIGAAICQETCQSTGDCSLSDNHCVSGLCQTNFCGSDELGNAVAGTFDGPCIVDDGGPGTCIPAAGLSVDAEHPEFGLCVRPGLTASACQDALYPTPLSVPSEPGIAVPLDQLCVAGDVCVSGGCTTVCDPLSDAGAGNCLVGQVCLEHDGDPVTHLGFCGACLAAGSFCIGPGECCGTCVGDMCQ